MDCDKNPDIHFEIFSSRRTDHLRLWITLVELFPGQIFSCINFLIKSCLALKKKIDMEEILDQRGNIWGYRNYFLPQTHQIYNYIQFFLKEIQKLAMWLLNIRWIRKKNIKIGKKGTSLELQWLRTQLPMQETWVRSLVWGDPICPGAAKPLNHRHWAHAPEQVSLNYGAHAPQLWSPCA